MDDQRTRRMILVLSLMGFLCNGDNYAAAALLVQIARDLGLEIGQAALSVTAYMLPFGLFTLLFGPLADRFGKARIINIAAFGTALFSGLGALAFDLGSLSLIRAVNGAFAAGIMPVAMSLIGDRLGRDPAALQRALGKVFGVTFLGGASATAIGGALAYLGSWRLVYLVYGAGELLLALAMLRLLRREPGVSAALSLSAAYGQALRSPRLLKAVGVLFLMGLSVLGSFSYAGKLIETRTSHGVLAIGLILSSFGLATLLGGRLAALHARFGHWLYLLAGVVAAAAWAAMGLWRSPALLSVSLAGFGLGFIALQPTLVGAAQQALPQRRGTAMSLVAFAMLTGGGVGTALNGVALRAWGLSAIFAGGAALILIAGALTAWLVRTPERAPNPHEAQQMITAGR